MRSTRTRQCSLPFGYIADILFQVIINGEASTILSLCLVNRSTYETIKVLEPHICRWFMRLHGVDKFDSLLTLEPWTGGQRALTVHTLVRFLYRHQLARRLSLSIVPAVWGPFYDDDEMNMNFEAELKLARRLERGLHVLFHMADIARDTRKTNEQERQSRQKCCSLSSLVSQRLAILTKLLDEYSNFETNSAFGLGFNFPLTRCNSKNRQSRPASKLSSSLSILGMTQVRHLSRILANGHIESIIGTRRLAFRSHIDVQTEIAFHCTLRMLRELLERILLRHGPRLWHRDTRDKYSVTLWFLLNLGPRSLARLFLSEEIGDGCCHDLASNSRPECLLSNPLDEYWDAWMEINTPSELDNLCTSTDADKDEKYKSWGMTSRINMGMRIGMGSSPLSSPSPTRLTMSWSIEPALFDTRGRKANRAAERYLKEMWGKRHVGLNEAFTIGVFASVL